MNNDTVFLTEIKLGPISGVTEIQTFLDQFSMFQYE